MSDEWKDTPDSDGAWWVFDMSMHNREPFMADVSGDYYQKNGCKFEPGAHLRWQKAMRPESVPPAPLPSSLAVTIRGDIIKRGYGYQGRIFAGDKLINCTTESRPLDRFDAEAWVRDWAGVEPRLVGVDNG